MRTIKVTGKSQMKVKPDMTRITIFWRGYAKSMVKPYANLHKIQIT